MDYNKHEPEEHDELPPFTSEAERDELTAPSQAATPAAQTSDEGVDKVMALLGPACCDCMSLKRIKSLAAAIRAAEVAKANEKLEELAVQDDRAVAFAEERMRHTNENDEYYYTLRADAQRFRNAASHVRSLKLPSPSPEKEEKKC